MESEGGWSVRGLARQLYDLVRQNKRLVAASVCAVVFLALLEDVMTVESMKLDRAAY